MYIAYARGAAAKTAKGGGAEGGCTSDSAGLTPGGGDSDPIQWQQAKDAVVLRHAYILCGVYDSPFGICFPGS